MEEYALKLIKLHGMINAGCILMVGTVELSSLEYLVYLMEWARLEVN